jgi:hypothetical protein
LVGKANKLDFKASIKDFIYLGGPPTNLTRNQRGIFLSWWGNFVAKLSFQQTSFAWWDLVVAFPLDPIGLQLETL